MGIPLHGHQLGHLDRADLGDAAHIISAEVDQHDMFCLLLLVGQKILFQRQVFLPGLSPPAGAGNGPELDLVAFQTDHHFRRAPHKDHAVHLQVEEVGRGIDASKGAINIKGLTMDLR